MLSKKLIKAAAGNAAPTEYQISRSLRFNSADSAYLSRTPAGAGNRKTWTWSGWVKRSQLSSSTIFAFFGACNATDSNANWLGFVNDSLAFIVGDGASGNVITSAVYRDTSAWQHIVFVYDSGQATSSNRQKIYVNGVLVTSFSASTYVTQNLDGFINNNVEHNLGARVRPSGTSLSYFNGYFAEVHFVDGQALTADDFGETDATTGVWKPKAYTGTYGTNGFYLNFSDNTGVTAATLGADSSGNGNNWTPNNFSVTAGAGNDSLVDTPTPYGTDTGAGGEVRGNYCTLNPLANSFPSQPASWTTATITQGNLRWVSTATERAGNTGTIAVASGKFYWEVSVVSASAGSLEIGVAKSNSTYGGAGQIEYQSNTGEIFVEGVLNSTGSTYTSGDVIGVAYNADDDEITFYKNNVSQGVVSLSGFAGTLVAPMVMDRSSSAFTVEFNFGARPFAYTAPSGFKALCTQNLPTPTVVQGDDYFNTVLWTGTGATNSITGVGFQPDWVWIKQRSGTRQNNVYDAIRGATKELFTDSTEAENTLATGLTSFDSDGFTLGTGTRANESGFTYVGWNWNAGGSNATNTDGTITSTVRANTTAGFSIVSYTGNGTRSGQTVGHGLGVAPSMIIHKPRSTTGGWFVTHSGIPNAWILLDLTNASSTGGGTNGTLNYQSTNTTTVFSFIDGSSSINNVNGSGTTYIAYCFAEIEGFSKFGSYTGNGSTDGPFVYCGFRPAFVMIKVTSTTGAWHLFDSARNTYNVWGYLLAANISDAEYDLPPRLDALSNGFKLRGTTASNNASGQTYIFMAFAENPFKYSLAQ